jgi:uncharacterized membrane protein
VSIPTPEPRRLEKKSADKKAAKKSDERPRASRLDQPRELRRPLLGRAIDRATAPDQDRLGRFAERFARFMGTARFLIYMTLVVAVWVGYNYVAPKGARFDDYPFIFLTLMLSLQASYAAPLILLAQNRQELRDRVITEQDRQANARAHADMEFLAREVATRDFLRSELRDRLEELEELRHKDAAEGEPGTE